MRNRQIREQQPPPGLALLCGDTTNALTAPAEGRKRVACRTVQWVAPHRCLFQPAAGAGGDTQPGARPIAESLDTIVGNPEWRFSAGARRVPWLAPERDAERQRTNRFLEVLRRPIPYVLPWEGYYPAYCLVSAVEQDLLRARELLNKSQSELLSPTDWRTLSDILVWHQDKLAHYRDCLAYRLRSLSASAASSRECQRLAHDLQGRLGAAHACLLGPLDQDWHAICKRARSTLPVDAGAHAGKTVEVECRTVPGTALGASFAKGYEADDSRFGDTAMPGRLFDHVPGLAYAESANASGETLYCGLRHRFIDLTLLNCGFLKEAANAGDRDSVPENRRQFLARLVRDLLAMEHWGGAARSMPEESVNGTRAVISFPGDGFGKLAAAQMRCGARRVMVRELAVAALATDTLNRDRALDGERVDLRLLSIAMAFGERFESRLASGVRWDACDQAVAFADLAIESPVQLRLRGPDGALRTVLANVRVRQFVFEPGGLLKSSEGLATSLRTEWRRLIGPGDSRALGGDVKARIDAMRARMLVLDEEIVRSETTACPAGSGRSPTVSGSTEVGNRLARCKREADRLGRNARTLEEAGQQLKDTFAGWREGALGFRSEQPDMKGEIVARLALIGYLMGETPVLSAATCAAMCDIECKTQFLAMVADNREGRLPPLECGETWRSLYLDFKRQMVAVESAPFVGQGMAESSGSSGERRADPAPPRAELQ